MIIRPDDMAKVGYCAAGVRRWFIANGLDFRDFIKNGIDADVLIATGDALTQRVIDAKIARESVDE